MRRSATLLLIAAVLALALPARSIAGSYQVTTCNFAPEAVNNSWVWASSDASPIDHYTKHENCPERKGGTGGSPDQEGGLSTTDTLGLENGAPTGTRAGWTFTAPLGTAIESITYERYIGHYLDPKNAWSPALRAGAAIVPGETCLDTVENGELCYIGAPANEGAEVGHPTGLHAHTLTVGINCEAAHEECITGAKYHDAWAAMYGATVTLSDPSPPTLGEPSGPLWEAVTLGRYSKGSSETLNVSAADEGGGVRSISITSEGKQLANYEAPCDFTRPQSCPLSIVKSIPVPLTKLPDGQHSLLVVATDAAGNQTTLPPHEIIVANEPPPQPTGMNVSAAGDGQFSLTWAVPPTVPIPIQAAEYELCSASGSCSAPTIVPASGPISLAPPAPGEWIARIWFVNAAGNSGQSNALSVRITTTLSAESPHTTTKQQSSTPPKTMPTSTKPLAKLSIRRGKKHIVIEIQTPRSVSDVSVVLTLGRHTIATRKGRTVRGRLLLRVTLGPRASVSSLRVAVDVGSEQIMLLSHPKK